MEESEQEIQGLLSLSSRCAVGPAMKRPRVAGCEQFRREWTLLARRRSASVEERKREVRVEFEMKCKTCSR